MRGNSVILPMIYRIKNFWRLGVTGGGSRSDRCHSLTKYCCARNVYACNGKTHGGTEVNGLIYDPIHYILFSHRRQAILYLDLELEPWDFIGMMSDYKSNS